MKKITSLLLLILSSLLFFLSFPSFICETGFGFLIFFAFIPLYFSIKKVSLKFSFIYGGVFALISYSLMGNWLVHYSLFCFISILLWFMILYMAFFTVLKLIFMYFNESSWLIYPFLLTAFDYLRTLGPFGFSYGVSGYAIAPWTKIIRISSFTGVFGVSFYIYCFASIVCVLLLKIKRHKDFATYSESASMAKGYSSLNFHSLLEDKKRKLRMAYIYVITGLYLAFTLFLLFVPLKTLENTSLKSIVAVQTNQDPWASGIEACKNDISDLMSLTKASFEENPLVDIVMWPETAVVPSIMKNYYDRTDMNRTILIDNLLLFMDNSPSSFLTGNFHSVMEYGKYNDYNSALFFTPQKNIYPPKPFVYSKMKLVPFSETVPFPKLFYGLVMENNYSNIHLWKEGKEYTVFNQDDFSFASPICFEDNFGNHCRNFILNGARAFLNLSNDSWAQSVASQNQHLYMAVFRSAENHVPQVRSTVSGQTAYIDYNGKVQKEIKPFSKAWLFCEIPVLPKTMDLTFYTKFGDVFSYAVIIICGFMLIIQSIIVIIRKIKDN